MKDHIAQQFAIFRNPHTWSLTALYIVTFGSFIGFSMVLPLAITYAVGWAVLRGAGELKDRVFGEVQ